MSNIQPYIILNGTNSRTISGLLISSLPPISKPQQRTLVDTVDGRDGDLVTPLGFSAYDKPISIALTYGYDIDEIIEFFNSSGVVTFSNEPDKYYRYAIYEQIDFERLIRFKTAEVTLHCQPFKFSTTETPKLFNVTSGSPITVKNDGNYQSRPNLTIIGSGDVDLSLNGSQVLSLDLEDNQAIIIDTEDMNAYAAQTAIKEVIAEINPVQDLHGQEYPYPAGGGKNLINATVRGQVTDAGITSQIFEDNHIVASGTSTGNGDIGVNLSNDLILNSDKTYTLSFTGTDVRTAYLNVYFRIKGGSYTSPINIAIDDHSKSITGLSGTYDRILLRMANTRAITMDAKIMLEEGSTATDYAPYSNICPITGFTESNVRLYGADICGGDYLADLIVANIPNAVKDEVNKTVSYTAASASSRKLFDKFKPNTVYTFFIDTASANTNLAVNYTDGTSMRLNVGVNITDSSKSVAYLRGQNQTQSTVLNYEKCGIMEGELTASDFVPYLGSEYTIEFVDDQGDPITAYSGRINFTTGVLTLDKLIVDLSTMNFDTYSSPSSHVFRAVLSTALPNVQVPPNNITATTAICSKYLSKAYTPLSSADHGRFAITDGGTNRLVFIDHNCNTVEEFMTANADTQLLYPISTPIEIQLTPTVINNLLGLNQMYADNNGDISVTFSSNGVIRTETGDIVAFNCGAEDMTKGILLNRLITGNYDKIRLSKGDNTIVLSGGAQQFVIDKYSRWI